VPASQSAFRRLCLAVDVESYSKRLRDEQLDLQNRLLWAMVQGCRAARVNPARCDRQDSGDGQILILPPGVDERAVLPDVVLGLLTALHRVNNPVGRGGRIRLRVSIGQGAIQVGALGFVAPAVVTVCRLLDSDELRIALAARPVSDAAFIVTADLFNDMFAEGYGGLPAADFRAVHISRSAKGFSADAWIQVPGPLPMVATVPDYPDATELQRRQRAVNGMLLDLSAAASLAWALYAGSKEGSSIFGLQLDMDGPRRGPGDQHATPHVQDSHQTSHSEEPTGHSSPSQHVPDDDGATRHAPYDSLAAHDATPHANPHHDTGYFSASDRETGTFSTIDRDVTEISIEYYSETEHFVSDEGAGHAGTHEVTWHDSESDTFGYDLTESVVEYDGADDTYHETDDLPDSTDHHGHY